MSPVTASTRTEWSNRLAQALVQAGYETEANLTPLLSEATATDRDLATLLIGRGLALPGVVVGTMAQLAQLPAVDLAAFTPTPEASAALGPDVGRDFGALGLRFDGNALAVAFCEPPTQEDQDALASRIGYRVRPVLGDPVLIAQALGVSADGNGTTGNGTGNGAGTAAESHPLRARRRPRRWSTRVRNQTR